MMPAFLFPVCDDCGETLTPDACGGSSHICVKPNSDMTSAIKSLSAPSISPRHAASFDPSLFFPVIASAPRDIAIMKLADVA